MIAISLHEDFLKGLCMRITTVLSVARATEGNKQNVKQKKSTANTLGIKK